MSQIRTYQKYARQYNRWLGMKVEYPETRRCSACISLEVGTEEEVVPSAINKQENTSCSRQPNVLKRNHNSDISVRCNDAKVRDGDNCKLPRHDSSKDVVTRERFFTEICAGEETKNKREIGCSKWRNKPICRCLKVFCNDDEINDEATSSDCYSS